MAILRTTSSLFTRTLAVGTLAALALAGCSGDDGGGSDGETQSGESLDLDGKTFTATETAGWVIVTGTTIQLTFDDDAVSAQAGCNTLTGGATWTDGTLTLDGPLASTAVACERGLQAQDEWLTTLLESDPQLSLEGDALVIGTDRRGMTMTEDG